MLIGWDFGYKVQAVIICQLDDQDRIIVLRELTGNNVDTWTWTNEVLQYVVKNFPDASERYSFCDDAGRQRYETSDLSSFDILTAYGFTPISSKKPIMFGVGLIRRLLALRPDGTPGIYFDPSCEFLIEDWKGYHRPKAVKIGPSRTGYTTTIKTLSDTLSRTTFPMWPTPLFNRETPTIWTKPRWWRCRFIPIRNRILRWLYAYAWFTWPKEISWEH